jgi:energy-coupling factor transporter ATP-binding protein EcfA2
MDNNKIQEAQEILSNFDLPIEQQNQICALTLLALCNIKPNDQWRNAKRKSMTLAIDIMEFIKLNYDIEYKSGTRESFRKEALNPFVTFGLIDKNPDNPMLPNTSPNTHYAINIQALNVVKQYHATGWEKALNDFKARHVKGVEIAPEIGVTKLTVKGYKSIVSDTIELGRFNVFIGANGCGKTNILEVLATVGAQCGNDLTFDGLYNRGVRIARPDLVQSSFLQNRNQTIRMDLSINIGGSNENYSCELAPSDPSDIYTKWINIAEEEDVYGGILLEYFEQITREHPEISGSELLKKANETIANKGLKQTHSFDDTLSNYLIYDLNTKSLRGITPVDSKKTPLGINGEGLDLLVAGFTKKEREQLNACLPFFDWLLEIVPDKDDKLKVSGLKPGRSSSTLYFKDKYMRPDNNIFSAENSNEGVLHVLFYLALFISNRTPKFFAIDNIETALNPRLCQILITELVKLSKESKRQVLITTHNPAILDGLNLLDDEQRLFEVYRNSEGATKTRRIRFKDDLSDKKFKLSELWLKGLLGAVPKSF